MNNNISEKFILDTPFGWQEWRKEYPRPVEYNGIEVTCYKGTIWAYGTDKYGGSLKTKTVDILDFGDGVLVVSNYAEPVYQHKATTETPESVQNYFREDGFAIRHAGLHLWEDSEDGEDIKAALRRMGYFLASYRPDKAEVVED